MVYANGAVIGSPGSCAEYCAEVVIPATELSSVSGSMISNITAEVVGTDLTDVCADNYVRVAYQARYIDNAAFFAVAPADNCGGADALIASFTQSSFDCTDFSVSDTVGIELTMTDAAGNATTDSANVILNNTPLAVAKDALTIPIQFFDSNGEFVVTPGLVDDGSIVACGGGILSVSPDTLDCSNVGVNVITLRIENPMGGFDEATTTVTVQADPTLPDPCNTCPDFVTINNNPILNGVYDANNTINSNGQVTGSANSNDVDFNAASMIILNPGFSVDQNANFNAVIQACPNN